MAFAARTLANVVTKSIDESTQLMPEQQKELLQDLKRDTEVCRRDFNL